MWYPLCRGRAVAKAKEGLEGNPLGVLYIRIDPWNRLTWALMGLKQLFNYCSLANRCRNVNEM